MMLSLRDEFGIVRIFRESRCKDTTSQRGRVGLGLVSVGISWYKLVSVGLGGFRWVSAFIIYIQYIYYICVQIDRVCDFA